VSQEDIVSHAVLRFFQGHGWHVLHYHPPGGQAAFSVTLDEDRIIPDMVALKNDVVYIIENKPVFCPTDMQKLTNYAASNNAVTATLQFVERVAAAKGLAYSTPFIVKFGHGFAGNLPPDVGWPSVSLFHLKSSDNSILAIRGI